MDEVAVKISGVTKHYKNAATDALQNVSASIKAGQITGLVGPDGAGKTTLMRLIASVLLPSDGNISVYGSDSARDAERIHEITGYMPQKFGLYEDLSVIENLELYAKIRGVVGQEKVSTFERMLAFTDLKRFTERMAGKLSGGMKQKLGLACALISRPKLLLLDEPSVGVDPISRRELWKMVQELAGEGMAVVWSTAYLDEAEHCASVILLNEGKVLFDGTPQDMTSRVEGRVFHLTVEEDNRRRVLKELLQRDDIVDGVIQGQKLRVVMRYKTELPSSLKPLKAAPRFEDAFMDILGGGPDGRSKLAEEMQPRPELQAAPILAEGLTKKFGSFTAAKDINFTIKRGEIFGLLGPNGAGKSTTFKMMCGLLVPTSGKALVTGLDLKTSSSAARSRIGYMAQKFSLYSDLSTKQNLEFFSGAYGLSGEEQNNKIAEMIEIFDLAPFTDTNTSNLPLGFKQRLALACAVMHQPDVLFLDEPTSGVDPVTRREFWQHIYGMVDKGVTIMVTTHFMDEAEYCDRIALIYRGESIAIGSPDSLKQSVACQEIPEPTLEDAFITLVKRFDEERERQAA